MPKVTYIAPDGTEHSVNLPLGTTVMQGAINNNIPGIEAECGGCCMCATCHVYVDEAFLGKLMAADDLEEGMLEETASPREDNSRLGCQIYVTDDLDGLVVRLPETQVK